MSQSKLPQRTLLLFSEYSEKGFQGAIEINDDFTIEVIDGTRTGKVVLTIGSRRTSFKSGETLENDISQYSITASDLVDLVKKHGQRVP